jgi:hypothetical protein
VEAHQDGETVILDRGGAMVRLKPQERSTIRRLINGGDKQEMYRQWTQELRWGKRKAAD